MGKIILGLDLDGVLYPYHEALYTFCQYEFDCELGFEEFWLDWIQNIPKEKSDYLISLPMPYETHIPSAKVMEFLNFIRNNADDIYYLTHRPIDLQRVTERYLRTYDFPKKENLFITGDKATSCRYLGITHFIDDFTSHVGAVAGIADAYLMAKPWNRDFQNDFNTVYNLKEFQERVFS